MEVHSKESNQQVNCDYKPIINLKIDETSKKYGEIFEQAIIKFIDSSYKSYIVSLDKIYEDSSINLLKKFCSDLKQSFQFMGISELDNRIESFINTGINKSEVNWSKLIKEKPYILIFLKEMYAKCNDLYPSFIEKLIEKDKLDLILNNTQDDSKYLNLLRK